MKFTRGWALPDDDEYIATKMDDRGGYQRKHLEAALELVVGWSLAVDGGGHIGTWSKPMAQLFGKVVTFEPADDSFACLAHNLHGINNVELHHRALGAEPGRARMTLDGYDKAIEMKNTAARFTQPGDEVDVIALDSLDLPALDFLKLDIEGGEVDALRGAEATMRRFKPLVLFENKGHCRRYGYGKNEPQRLLGEFGARHLQRIGTDEIWGW